MVISRPSHTGGRRQDALGGDGRDARRADLVGLNDRLDPHETEPQRTRRNKQRGGSGQSVGRQLGRAAAPGQRGSECRVDGEGEVRCVQRILDRAQAGEQLRCAVRAGHRALNQVRLRGHGQGRGSEGGRQLGEMAPDVLFHLSACVLGRAADAPALEQEATQANEGCEPEACEESADELPLPARVRRITRMSTIHHFGYPSRSAQDDGAFVLAHSLRRSSPTGPSPGGMASGPSAVRVPATGAPASGSAAARAGVSVRIQAVIGGGQVGSPVADPHRDLASDVPGRQRPTGRGSEGPPAE